ncbi:hypothetical protein [Nocardia sp. NPDC051750]|uniref:hypothetical protein n=1 Tax=Nocardia sp. NPDC051750 TaxID=3364325 RepID=UPI00379FB083
MPAQHALPDPARRAIKDSGAVQALHREDLPGGVDQRGPAAAFGPWFACRRTPGVGCWGITTA